MRNGAFPSGSARNPEIGADQAAFEIVRPKSRSPILLVCDHASNRIPGALGDLGLPAADRARHIAWDIGAADVTRALTGILDCTAVLSGWSRLVVDCNRLPGDPTFVWRQSDGTPIPGNAGLGEAEIERRRADWFEPYHQAIAQELERLDREAGLAALISVHSFTPMMRDRKPRPWKIGILWNRDPRLAAPMIQLLRARGHVVGDNEPYSAKGGDYTLDRHGGADGRPHVEIEIRQDLIAEPQGAANWARELAEVLAAVLANPGLNRREHFQF
jgi:predicted N-formylglutamate amidohydrolase